MNTRTRAGCIIIAGLATIFVQSMDQPIVVACNFEAISKNVDTANIVTTAISSAKTILPCLYWSSLAWFPSTLAHMQKRGLEIAATTPGITNTIKKLFTELEEQEYGQFTDTAISCINEMGVNPISDDQAISLLQEIKKFNIPTIGMGNQDSLEHEIYARKMLAEKSVDMHSLCNGIVTIPTLAEQTTFDLSDGNYFIRRAEHPRWLVARNISPSPSFTHTIKMLAHDLAGEVPIWSIDTKEQLAIAVNALRTVYEHHRSPSPETGKLLDEIMQQNGVISPTIM